MIYYPFPEGSPGPLLEPLELLLLLLVVSFFGMKEMCVCMHVHFNDCVYWGVGANQPNCVNGVILYVCDRHCTAAQEQTTNVNF